MDIYRSIIITGGEGMLAHALSDELRRRGVAFRAVGRRECDICQDDDVHKLFETARPTLLINCAAHTGVDACEDEQDRANALNGDAVGRLATFCRSAGTTLVHYSTDFVFDGQSQRPYRTSDPPHPVSVYGASKLLGEARLAEAAPPSWLILRTAWLYGGHGNCFPRTIVKAARAHRALRVVNDQSGAPTYTVDLAAATLNLLDAKAQGIFHVTNASETTWFDFAGAVLKEFDVAADLHPTTTADWIKVRPKQAKRPAYSVLDLAAYTQATGRTMRHWREALHDFAASFRRSAEFS